MPGARVSGLSRSSTFSRTPSNEHSRTIGDSTTSRSQSKPYDAHHRSTSSSSRPPLKTLDDAKVAPQAQSRSEKPRDLPQGFKPLSKQQLLEKRRRAELERQQSESGTSKLKSPAEEYKEKEEKVPGMFRLSQQQLHVRNLVVQEGKSVFFTGSAGESSCLANSAWSASEVIGADCLYLPMMTGRNGKVSSTARHYQASQTEVRERRSGCHCLHRYSSL